LLELFGRLGSSICSSAVDIRERHNQICVFAVYQRIISHENGQDVPISIRKVLIHHPLEIEHIQIHGFKVFNPYESLQRFARLKVSEQVSILKVSKQMMV